MNPREQLQRIRNMRPERQGAALESFLDQYCAELRDEVANTTFRMRFRTADGCEAVETRKGRPPGVFDRPMLVPMSPFGDLSKPPQGPRIRSYELMQLDLRNKTAIYREIVR